MANHLSNFFHFLVLVMMIMQLIAVGDAYICSELLGRCDTGDDCDSRCKTRHSDVVGIGTCDLNLCTCSYRCIPSDPPKKCLAGYTGVCDGDGDAKWCNSTCASVFDQGRGICLWYGKNYCVCQYNC